MQPPTKSRICVSKGPSSKKCLHFISISLLFKTSPSTCILNNSLTLDVPSRLSAILLRVCPLMDGILLCAQWIGGAVEYVCLFECDTGWRSLLFLLLNCCCPPSGADYWQCKPWRSHYSHESIDIVLNHCHCSAADSLILPRFARTWINLELDQATTKHRRRRDGRYFSYGCMTRTPRWSIISAVDKAGIHILLHCCSCPPPLLVS